ncbi:hypothetical protein [Nonomuraea pusilla]|uniref:Uncharacterized protein n=1 Tax=Nonomuraea pusilla TaxID=46177 RepID=A0A1H7GWG3_9ACTN|nr:hypothetical protein SAMN05660976_00514 [Nonomuraea pusilla]
MRFSSEILRPWCRKSPKVSEAPPLPYLHGPSSGSFVPAPEWFPGSAAGLSTAALDPADEAVAGRPRRPPTARPHEQ